VIRVTVVLNRHIFLIVGVLPREFHGLSADTAPDVRVPLYALPLLWNQPLPAVDRI
jgi:hypothetical protein